MTRYVVFFFGITCLLSGFASAMDYKPERGDLKAQICIERPENEGLLNIVPTQVEFSNSQKLSLLGGQSACILVEPGDYLFEIQSIDPYPSSHKGKAKPWRSNSIKVKVKEGETVTFEISPETDEHGYTGRWTAKRIGK